MNYRWLHELPLASWTGTVGFMEPVGFMIDGACWPFVLIASKANRFLLGLLLV